MTTLYEHKLLGSKISVVSANFNIPFLTGEGNICLFEEGIILLDEHGNEQYTIPLSDFDLSYEKFINLRKLRYIENINNISKNFKENFNSNKAYKKVNGNYYGKLVITIHKVGDIELFDNQSFKYKKFYSQINALKEGNNPLNIYKKNKKKSFLEFLKSRIFIKDKV